MREYFARTNIVLWYCLPAIVAIIIVLYPYFLRVEKVVCDLADLHREVQHSISDAELKSWKIKDILANNPNVSLPTECSTDGPLQRACEHFIRNDQDNLLHGITPLSDKPAQSCHLDTSANNPLMHFWNSATQWAQPCCAKEESDTDDTWKERQRMADDIWEELQRIWLRTSVFVALMVMLPYLFLGTKLAISRKLSLSNTERGDAARAHAWMKLLMAIIIAIGWIYILNPKGRGISTLLQYLLVVDLTQAETLPLYIKTMGLPPTIAAFMGWYLYLLTYFFIKVVHHDVISTRVYNLLFRKFLFTYGVALVLTPVDNAVNPEALSQVSQISLFMFLLGYFPLSGLSLLKQASSKMVPAQVEKGQLMELPGISRFQSLRLEEEGIDSISVLAQADAARLKNDLPFMAPMLDLWIDIAQLYAVVGMDNYDKVKSVCITASEFIARADDANFAEQVRAKEVGEAAEIARLLRRTFAERLRLSQETAGGSINQTPGNQS